MVKRQKESTLRRGRKGKPKRLLAGGDGKFGSCFKKNPAEERETGFTLLCFVRESALCCCRLSLNHQTQLIIVEEAQKAWKGGGAWLHCQREAGPRVCVRA